MDFYKELLESFSRITGRRLSLLEQEEDPRIPTALGILNNSQWKAEGPKSQVATVNGTQARYFPNTTKLIIANGDGLYNPKNNTLVSSGNDQRFKALLTAIVGEEEGVTKFETKRSKSPGEWAIERMTQTLSGLTKEIANSILKSFKTVSDNCVNRTWFVKLAKSVGMTPQAALGWFTGGGQQSLESRLTNLSFKLINKDGKLIKIESKPDAELRAKFAEKLAKLAALANGNKKTTNEGYCGKIRNEFAMTGSRESGDRSLIIAADNNVLDNDSTVVSDQTGLYEGLLNRAFNQCNKRSVPDEVDLYTDKAGGANANRGFTFEELPQVSNLFNLIQEAKANKDKSMVDCLGNQLTKLVKDIKRKVDKLTEQTESWTESEKQTGLDLEDAATLSMAKELIKKVGSKEEDFTTKLVKSMIPYGKEIAKRGSIMALPAGTDTGGGKRQDVIEVFDNCEDARGPASKLGVDPVLTPISDLSDDHQESLKCLKGSDKLKGLSEDSPEEEKTVCVINTSLKNYIGLSKGVTAGSQTGGSQARTVEIVDKILGDEELTDAESDIVNSEEAYKDFIGLDDKSYEEAAKVLKEGSDLNGFLINNEKVSVQVNGEQATANVFDTAGNIVVDSLIDAVGYLPESQEANNVRQIIEEYKGDPPDKIKRKVALYVEKQSLMSKINSGDQNAINALKLKMMRVGGDSTGELGLEIRDIKNNEIFGFKHNQPLEDAFANLGKPGSKWKINEGKPGSTTITLEDDNGNTISLEAVVSRKSNGTYSNSYSVHYGKKTISNYNKYPNNSESPKEESTVIKALSLIESILVSLKKKVNIINT